MAIHSRILADSSAPAQKASRCAVSLSEQMVTVFGIEVIGFFSFPGFAVKPLIRAHPFPYQSCLPARSRISAFSGMTRRAPFFVVMMAAAALAKVSICVSSSFV